MGTSSVSRDTRHRFYTYGTLNAGRFFRLGVILSASSGRPYTLTTGRDDKREGFARDRPPGVPRNSLEGPGAVTLDLRWSKNIFGHPQKKKETGPTAAVALDAFNVLNRVNLGNPVGNLSSPFFGRSISAGPARRLQVSLSFNF